MKRRGFIATLLALPGLLLGRRKRVRHVPRQRSYTFRYSNPPTAAEANRRWFAAVKRRRAKVIREMAQAHEDWFWQEPPAEPYGILRANAGRSRDS